MNAHDRSEKKMTIYSQYTETETETDTRRTDIETKAKRKVIKNREYCSNQCPSSKIQCTHTERKPKKKQLRKSIEYSRKQK